MRSRIAPGATLGRPRCCVARFHLGNGARLERTNWLADTSPRGLKQSLGMMVNYLYRLDEVEQNHEVYVREQNVRAARPERRRAPPLAPLYSDTRAAGAGPAH